MAAYLSLPSIGGRHPPVLGRPLHGIDPCGPRPHPFDRVVFTVRPGEEGMRGW